MQRFLHLLEQLDLDLDADAIADALWLAEKMGQIESISSEESTPSNAPVEWREIERDPARSSSSSTSPVAQVSVPSPTRSQAPAAAPGIPFQAPAAPALRKSLELSRSLRPLMRRVPSRTEQVLDEEETAVRIAESRGQRQWVPVFQPALERWLNLELVVEESRSMVIWEEVITEFQQLLERQGAFRTIRVWRLNSRQGILELYPRSTQAKSAQRARNPRELLDPTGRSLILFLSDGIARLWQQDQIYEQLQAWSKLSPVAWVQLLPERLWARSALGKGFSAQLRALVPGVPNAQLEISELPVWETVNLSTALTLPVVTLEPESLLQWAEMVAGSGSVRSPGVVFDLDFVISQARVAENDRTQQLSPEEMVQRFRATASPLARRLAVLMSMVPVSLPVVYLIQEAVLPASRQVHLAEVVMGGLLQVVSEEPLRYDFVAGVRDLLQASVSKSETMLVLDKVSQYIAERAGLSIKSFAALLMLKSELGTAAGQEIQQFAEISAQVLRRLGGEFAAFVDQLEQTEAFPALQEFEFETGWIEETASGEQPLQPFEFTVATIEIQRREVSVLTRLTSEGLERLEAVIQAQSLTPSALAKSAGMARNTIAKIRRRTEPMRLNTLQKLFSHLELELEDSDYEYYTNDPIAGVVMLRQTQGQPHFVIHQEQRQAWQFVEALNEVGVTLEMVSIPAGSFLMGSPEDEPERFDDESPQHPVTVSNFFMGKYPITQTQWKIVASLPQVKRSLDPDPSEFKGDDRPVEEVSWHDAVEFCDRLSKFTKREYRLPSEAEWEYACRAGTITPFYFGKTITPDLANYNWEASYGNTQTTKQKDFEGTAPAGKFGLANGFGLYDMHGNVWEWCQDHWHGNYKDAPTDGSAWMNSNASEDANHVVRGGSWNYFPRYCRSATRYDYDAGIRLNLGGFRVVCSVPRTL